ncbi:hypothetical protein J3F83DRAFT_733515 [Trichoderma novae-zelandiae]
MAMFEIIACQDRSSLEAWICHVQGAATLIQHWTAEDWKRTMNARAFMHFFYLLAMGCLIKRMPVPTHVRELARTSAAFVSDIHLLPARSLFEIVCRVAELHSRVDTAQVAQITEKVSIAIGIEEELRSWETHLPDMWKYTTAQDGSPEEDGPRQGSCHEYACPWQAYVWNQYRACRILVHTVLLRYLDTLAFPITKTHPALMAAYTSRQEASRAILSTTMLDMRAGMSYILGLYDKGKGNSSLSPEHSGVFGLLGAVQALMGVVDVRGEDAGWLCEMLGVMGGRWGIGLAAVLGRELGRWRR